MNFQAGDYVKAISGPFKGQKGWVSRTDSDMGIQPENACVIFSNIWDHGIWVEVKELKRTKRFKNVGAKL